VAELGAIASEEVQSGRDRDAETPPHWQRKRYSTLVWLGSLEASVSP